ncbi:AsmA family protein [Lewinella sp. IMCC34191]|uniref:AsmA family protein n=1 Tax=Lewinella sp. IMCC34191 TaxID=2259172 RepID=UPI000E26E2E6|nr:AsmA family protein [Lewinella sp. IMCC34191]
MKLAKRILIGVLVFVVILVGLLAVAPIIFKDEIVANVKSAVNNAVEAEVDFADANVSFLRSFPDIALTVDDYSVIGVDTFAGLPLVSGSQARVDLGFWSVIAGDGNYHIDAVILQDPDVNLLVLNEQLANYLIVAESADPAAATTDTTASSAVITLEHFEINNGRLVYDDRVTETYVRLDGLNATGEGDFTASVFDVVTQARADAFTLRQAGMTYLNETRMTADGTVNVDADNMRYTFTEADVTLNELALVMNGSIDLEDNDDILFDLNYEAPANDFRQLWSLVPAAYTEGFEQVQTGGTFTLNGTVEGAFNSETETYPAFTVNSQIDGGSVQYPGKPVGINGIDAELAVNSPSSDLDELQVSIPRFNFTLGNDPFEGSFRLATPLSDPDVDARLNGTLDLAKWASAMPLEGVNELAGRIVADITMNNVRQSALEAGRYADVNLSGDLLVSNLVYAADGLPPMRIAQARADFSPQAIDLQQFTATLGQSDVSASGQINNILAYFSPDQTMRGSFTMRSNYFNADEWMTEETTDRSSSPAEMEVAAAEPATEVFDRFDFDLDAQIQELAYGTYHPTDLRVAGNIKPNRLVIDNASATLQESSFDASGTISNLFDYTFGEGVLTGNIDVRSGFFNVADFMSEEAAATATTTDAGTTAPAEAAVIPIPKNINLRVNMAADRVQYTDIIMNGMRGDLVIQDGAAMIENGRANLLGGSMGFRGAYDTSDETDEPVFRFAYDMEQLDFGQAFTALNSFAALAPIGKFITGNFSSEMLMEGRLGSDLLPVLNSIDAQGLLRTAEARIASFKPLQVIGRALNVKELRESATLKNIIAAFEIKDGMVTVEPFDFALAGIGMTVAGSHGLNTDMDYRIRAAIPRDLVEGNIIGGAALSALENLGSQAKKLGLNISPGDTLNLDIALTGSISDPKTGINLLGTGSGSSQSTTGAIAGALQDRAEEEVRSRVDSARQVAEQRAEVFRDTLERAAAEQAKRLEDAAAERVRGALGLNDSTTTIADSLDIPNLGKEAVEDVKAKLEKFNPFKRNKNGG